MRFCVLFALALLAALELDAQSPARIRFGVKGGINFVNVQNAGSINGSNTNGFMAGVFMAPPVKKVLGYRSEVIFSRQGYNFKTAETTGSVKLNYILLPQLTTVNITRFVQLQVGGQVGFLLNSSIDSISSLSTVGASGKSYFNSFTYGLAGGLEVHPVKTLLAGARLNVNMAPVSDGEAAAGRLPSYIPTDGKKLRNNVVQVYVGVMF